MPTTKLSTKGQIVLPKEIRSSHSWGPGTEFTVEETRDGILLRPARPLPRLRVEDVAGCLRPKVKPKNIDTRLAVARGVARRHARGRY